MPQFPFRIPLLAMISFLLGAAILPAAPADSLIDQGDRFAKKYDEEDALKEYLAAEKLDPANSDLLLKISRQYRHSASDASRNSDKVRLSRTALSYAERAVALAPNNAEAHLSVAVSYGKMLPYLGNKEQVQAQSKLRAAVDKSLLLNPKSDLAWHVLGRWHQVLADVKGVRRGIGGLLYGSLPSTTPEAAVKCYEKAIALDPYRPRHFIELGRTYAQMGKNTDAKRLINKGLAMPNIEKDDPEIKLKGREALAKLK